jgi:hypothetical protein
VSPSKKPGAASISSPALRILTDDRSNGEGFVVVLPLIWSVALAGLTRLGSVSTLVQGVDALSCGDGCA